LQQKIFLQKFKIKKRLQSTIHKLLHKLLQVTPFAKKAETLYCKGFQLFVAATPVFMRLAGDR